MVHHSGESTAGEYLHTLHLIDRPSQKNDTLVRAGSPLGSIGHRRLDTAAQCAALNTLYAQMGFYDNLFQPVLHLVGKEVIAGIEAAVG